MHAAIYISTPHMLAEPPERYFGGLKAAKKKCAPQFTFPPPHAGTAGPSA